MKLYTLRRVLMYVSETRALRKAEQDLLGRSEIRMLRCMMGKKRIEKTRNEQIKARADVANISEKERVGWLGHVETKAGRPKLRRSDVIQKITKETGVQTEEHKTRKCRDSVE